MTSEVLFCSICVRAEEHCRCPIPNLVLSSDLASWAPFTARSYDAELALADKIRLNRISKSTELRLTDYEKKVIELALLADEAPKVRAQTRVQSMIEVATNYIIGFLIAWLTQEILLNWVMGYNVSGSSTFWFTVVFTVVSVTRSYLVRRLFVYLHR